jgi:hypothetical protein
MSNSGAKRLNTFGRVTNTDVAVVPLHVGQIYLSVTVCVKRYI